MPAASDDAIFIFTTTDRVEYEAIAILDRAIPVNIEAIIGHAHPEQAAWLQHGMNIRKNLRQFLISYVFKNVLGLIDIDAFLQRHRLRHIVVDIARRRAERRQSYVRMKLRKVTCQPARIELAAGGR